MKSILLANSVYVDEIAAQFNCDAFEIDFDHPNDEGRAVIHLDGRKAAVRRVKSEIRPYDVYYYFKAAAAALASEPRNPVFDLSEENDARVHSSCNPVTILLFYDGGRLRIQAERPMEVICLDFDPAEVARATPDRLADTHNGQAAIVLPGLVDAASSSCREMAARASQAIVAAVDRRLAELRGQLERTPAAAGTISSIQREIRVLTREREASLG